MVDESVEEDDSGVSTILLPILLSAIVEVLMEILKLRRLKMKDSLDGGSQKVSGEILAE